MIVEKYNISLRSVEENDAAFIISLRTDAKKSRYISNTSKDIEVQQEWIKNYKIKEADKKEFYFIAIDENQKKFATYRVYNIDEDICEIGSWVSKPNYSNTNNSIKVDIIMKEFVFEILGFSKLRFEVNKENYSVIKYHKLFNPNIVKETEENFYFVLHKYDFEESRNKFFKNIK